MIGTPDSIDRTRPGEDRSGTAVSAILPSTTEAPALPSRLTPSAAGSVQADIIGEAIRQGKTVTMLRQADERAEGVRDHARCAAVLEALDHLDIGLFLVNRQGYVTDFNEAGSQLLGIDHTSPWENRHVSNLNAVFPGDVYEQFDRLLSNGRSCIRREITVSSDGGRPTAVTLCALPMTSRAGGEVVGIIRESDSERERALRTSEELSILTEVAAALSSSLELKQILQVILTGATASQGLGFNRAFLFLYDQTRHDLTAHMAVGPVSAEEAGVIWSRLAGMHLSLGQLLDVHPSGEDGSDPLFDRIKGLVISLDDDSTLARVCETGVCVNLERQPATDDLTLGLLDRTGSKTAAIVPLVSKGKCHGVILADNAITGAALSDDSVRVLKVLADQAAVAIQRARLRDTERERTRELERTYRRLARSQDQVVRAEKMSVMGEITSAVAEELRNPLTIISGFVNMLGESQRGEEIRECLNIIASEVRRADSVLQQVIEFASASSRQNQVFDYSVLTANTLDRYRSKSGCRGGEVTLSVAPERLPVYGNPDQLGNALYQLLQLVAEEASEARLELRTERSDSRARLVMSFVTDVAKREKLLRSLDQVFARQTATQRLQVLVAGETIKCHGGDYRLTTADSGAPLLVLEIPLVQEGEVVAR